MSAAVPLRIMYVWDADYPWDVRTEKICSALRREGHEVHIAARNRSAQPELEELPEGTVHRMPRLPVFNNASGFPAFFNPRWIVHLRRVVQKTDPHLIIVRDLPLCPTAIWTGRRYRIPVILDMAENYPAMIADLWTAGTRRPWDVLVRNPALVRAVERRWLPQVDHLITVVDESADRVHRTYPIGRDRISVVSNTPSRARVSGEPRVRRDPGPLTVVYLGLMEIPRGVGDLLTAQALLKRKGANTFVRLIGDGRDLPSLRQHAESLGLGADDVEFLGRLPHRDALRMVSASDVGVVPHHANESWNTTIPNKLFDYMAAGLPVISSDTVPCRRVVEETAAGLVYASGDAAGLAEAIESIRPPDVRSQMAANGMAAIRATHNWEADTDRLRQAVARTTASGKRPGGFSRTAAASHA